MNLQAKARVKEMVAERAQEQYNSSTKPVAAAVALLHTSVRTPTTETVPDELVIELTGNGAFATCTLRPAEVSRLRGRFGKGPGFEQWVVARIRDAMISFGGG